MFESSCTVRCGFIHSLVLFLVTRDFVCVLVGDLFPGIPIVFCSLSVLRKWQENMGTTGIVIFFP